MKKNIITVEKRYGVRKLIEILKKDGTISKDSVIKFVECKKR